MDFAVPIVVLECMWQLVGAVTGGQLLYRTTLKSAGWRGRQRPSLSLGVGVHAGVYNRPHGGNQAGCG